MNGASALDMLFFVAMPYAALVLFFTGTIVRYRSRPFTFSSLSTQFLENKRHFWAQVPFHYGLLVVLAGHVVAFLIPRAVLAWNEVPLRLYVLEGSALAFALLALIGLVNIVRRRVTDRKSHVTTTPTDWVLYGLLLLQLGTGLHIAVSNTWGSSWFAAVLSPYLWSIVKFSPEVAWVAPLSFTIKLHIVGLWALLALFPFTRLVHVLVVPNPYLWRRPQVVRWYGIRRGRTSTADARHP
jgi:nitrate reductase gamma subunit